MPKATDGVCWYCETPFLPGGGDIVRCFGERMHRRCRDAHLREEQIQAKRDRERDHQPLED